MKSFTFFVIALSTIAGCGGEARDDGGTSTGALSGGDIRATNCEIFVDRIMPLSGSHAVRRITAYVKTINDRLDAPIDHVGFYRKRTDTACANRGDCAEAWREERLNAFVGSPDYFEVELFIGGDYSPDNRWEGAFFVQTKNGTKYWANPEGGGNFVFDGNEYDRLRGNPYTTSPSYRSDPQAATATADKFTDLNPQRCR